MSGGAKSAATLLVEIAKELFTFGCVSEQRGHTSSIRGDDPVAVYTYASPKKAPDIKRPLPDIRPDIALVYQTDHGKVPAASALGDAMTVLEGIARAAGPTEVDPGTLGGLLAMLGGSSGTIATQLVSMAQEHYTFGVTTTGETYAVPIDGPNVARVLRGGRRSLRAELARLYYEKTKGAANAQALADALLVLEGEAQGLEPTEVALRVGRSPLDDGRLVLDLGGDDGRVAVIGAYGWEIVDRSPVLFWRTNATLPLPMPDDLGSLDDLRQLLNVSDTDWPLIVAWLVAALIPEIPHPVLLLRGEHGTAKSSAARLLTALIDRCASQLRTAPRNVEDWCVAAAGSWVTCLDNTSDLQPWLQDAICRAVTGDGLLRRQLYTDSDVSVLAFRRVVALTSIDPGRINGDLADRLLTVELDRIGEDARASEQAMTEKWSAIHAGVLGGLLHITVNVLRAMGMVRTTSLPRMADFARVLLAVDEVLDTNGYSTYAEQASRTAETVAEGDLVVIAIRERVITAWQGTASELLKKLTPEKPPKEWPATPQGMGARLTRAAPTLRSLGWTVEKLLRTDSRGSRGWSIIPPAGDAERYPAGSSATPASSDTPPDQGKLSDVWTDDQSSTDDQPSQHGRRVPPGQDVTDGTDNLAGVSSARPLDSECPDCCQPIDGPPGDGCQVADLHAESAL